MTSNNEKPRDSGHIVGRAAQTSPPNRFELLACEQDLEQLSAEVLRHELASSKVPTEFYVDESRTLIRANTSPDVPFRYSINPYRGCEHGCAYCYARPSHETLGLNAGLDFETKVFVKEQAVKLLRDELNQASWKGDPITISGITDCYQPAERVYQVTRGCLEVFAESNQPFDIITKNALVVRDLDIMEPAASRNLVHVHVSVTTLDAELCRKLEPRTSAPAARLRAIEKLSKAGVPVSVMLAPVIPGMTDHEVPAILKACADAGATTATWLLLRLPMNVAP
ncbi:MAG: PA0069 family radical SAM protein, partial [Planctomycetota bacterium]